MSIAVLSNRVAGMHRGQWAAGSDSQSLQASAYESHFNLSSFFLSHGSFSRISRRSRLGHGVSRTCLSLNTGRESIPVHFALLSSRRHT
jgi:hypothetical protein